MWSGSSAELVQFILLATTPRHAQSPVLVGLLLLPPIVVLHTLADCLTTHLHTHARCWIHRSTLTAINLRRSNTVFILLTLTLDGNSLPLPFHPLSSLPFPLEAVPLPSLPSLISRPPLIHSHFLPSKESKDLPSTLSDNLWKLIYLATEALSDSFEFIGAIQISLSIYLSIPLPLLRSRPIIVSRGAWGAHKLPQRVHPPDILAHFRQICAILIAYDEYFPVFNVH